MPTKTYSKWLRLYETAVFSPSNVKLQWTEALNWLIKQSQSLHPSSHRFGSSLSSGVRECSFPGEEKHSALFQESEWGRKCGALTTNGFTTYLLFLCKNINVYSQVMKHNCVKCHNYMVANWVKQRDIIYWEVFDLFFGFVESVHLIDWAKDFPTLAV